MAAPAAILLREASMNPHSAPIGDAAWRARRRARRLRDWLLQGAVALLLLALLAGIAGNIAANLEARQIKSGFDFLHDPAGFNIGEALFDFTARDSYLRAFAVGMGNTLRVALAGIVLASVLGVVVGLMRLSHHPLVAWLGAAYVELFRNIPLLIQLLAIYLLVTELLPEASSAISIEGAALLSKEGLQIAVPAAGHLALLLALVAFVLGAVLGGHAAQRWLKVGSGLVAIAGGAVCALVAWLATGALGGWSKPVLDGFLITGGASLTPEFLALWLGLSLFTSASIAELVRAGVLAVPAGQWQAALALGMTPRPGDRRRGLSAGAAAGDPAAREPVHEPDQELVARGGDRLPGSGVDRQHLDQPERPGARGHRDHHGGLPEPESDRRGDHERGQRARHARAALGANDEPFATPPWTTTEPSSWTAEGLVWRERVPLEGCLMSQRALPDADVALHAAAPPGPGRLAQWRAGLFSSPGASLVTVVTVLLLGWLGWHLLDWGVIDAVTAPDYAACKAAEHGACWGFVAEKWRLILFGRYPYEQQWRPALATAAVLAMLVASALPQLWSRRGARALALGWIARLRGVLHADVRRRVRSRADRHRPLGRPAADGDPDADRHRRLGADRHRAGAGAALVADAAALAARSPTSSWCAACR